MEHPFWWLRSATAAALTVVLSACSASVAQDDTRPPAVDAPTDPTLAEAPPVANELAQSDTEIRAELPVDEPAQAETRIMCDGILQQGGLVICTGLTPGQLVYTEGHTHTADDTGAVAIGLAQRAESELIVSPGPADTAIFEPVVLQIAPRDDPYRVIEGFDCDKVDARSDAQKAHAARSWTIKQNAFATFHEGRGALDGFILPTDGPTSSPFGPTRKYIGVSSVTGEPCEKTSIHRGYDMATPVGTPVIAPATGTVILADDDLYYEGGTVFLDHGQGLVSVFMHLSSVDVSVGDVVSRGDLLARTGNTGRTTGPHLHWAVKWRDRNAETRAGDFYIDPALLLDLPVTP